MNFESLREILAEIVRSAGLQRFAIAHHRFDGKCFVGAREPLGVRLFSGDHGHGCLAHGEIRVDVEHLARFEVRFGKRGVRRVALLPEKFECAQEKLGAQLPADHAVPLIDQQRKVAIRLNPFCVRVADNRFRSGADD